MIEVRNLYKRYHNHHGSDWILKDINFTIPTGVSVGIIGGNGAGKSTLLRLVAGMDTPDKGEIIRNCSISWPVGLKGGFNRGMTGRQNVKFVARALGKAGQIRDVVDFVTDFADIGDAFDEPVRTYSSGMRSRLLFGLSLAFEYDVYISDEATAVGDRSFKNKARQLFKERVGQSSLLMVSHSERILTELCTAGLYLKNGTVRWYDNIFDALDEYNKDVGGGVDKRSLPLSDENNPDLLLSKPTLLRKRLARSKSYLAGLRFCLRYAKEAGWDRKKITIISEILKEEKENKYKFNELWNTLSIREKQQAEKELNKAEFAVEALQAKMNDYDIEKTILLKEIIKAMDGIQS